MSTGTERVTADIFQFLEQSFGFAVKSSKQINRGWLNRKWIVKTDNGDLFVKQYHPQRYERYKEKAYDEISTALSYQSLLHVKGVPCPFVFSLEGNHLLRTPTGENIAVMQFHDGNLIKPGTATPLQMYHLGKAVGEMHAVLAKFPDGNGKPCWIPSQTELLESWMKQWEKAEAKGAPDILSALELQHSIIQRLEMELFEACEQGWAHSDLWVDNLLFHSDKLSAIIDFDRLRYIYPELDVARAILSCALSDGSINREAVSGFLNGYRESDSFPSSKLVRAMKLIWCLEAKWWITSDMDQHSFNPARFAEEMIWVANNWAQLENIFADA